LNGQTINRQGQEFMAQVFNNFAELKMALTSLTSLGAEDYLAAVLLTPDLAADILSHDPVNRKIRMGNLAKLKREIEGGFWDARKCTAMRFLPSGRMADGQHRCRAVVETKIPIIVSMTVVGDTVGVDEGAGRTLTDHLQLTHGLDEIDANLASGVTKALCHLYAPGNREWLEFFKEHKDFILESVAKPQDWLNDQGPAVSAIFKPSVITTMRARAIVESHEPAESVDELLYDAINAGTTAPEGSPRQALAKQFYEAMENAFTSRKAKRKDMMKWLLAALHGIRENKVRNILTVRLAGDKKKHSSKRAA
jgi:hypothetical protein